MNTDRKSCETCRYFTKKSKTPPLCGQCTWNGPRPSHFQRAYGGSMKMQIFAGAFGENCDAWEGKSVGSWKAVEIAKKAIDNAESSKKQRS